MDGSKKDIRLQNALFQRLLEYDHQTVLHTQGEIEYAIVAVAQWAIGKSMKWTENKG